MQPELFGASDPLLVLLDWLAPVATRCEFSVDVLSADGRLVFSASHDAGVVQGVGTVQLEVARLGLGEGSYELAVLAKAEGRAPPPPTRVGFKVGADASATGLLRPVLVWSQAARQAG